MPVQQQQKKRQPSRRSEPKLFRCTGFGNCDMVFTRSEHLARHARKHTGEKPFKCIVPNCDRTFSRFDNMMQHTHTHTRTKKKDDSYDGKSSPMSIPEDKFVIPANMPTSPRSYIEYQKLYMENYGGSKILPANAPRPPNEPVYPPPSYSVPPPYYQYPPPPSPNTNDEYYYQQPYYNYPPQHYMQQWPPVYYTPNTPPQYHQVAVMVPPSSASIIHNQSQQQQPNYNDNSSVPPTANNYSKNVRKNSLHSETTQHRRRLSYIELTTPIQELGSYQYNHSPSSSSTIREDNSTVCTDHDDDDEGEEEDDDERQMSPLSMDTHCTTKSARFKANGEIDITPDEYEALQGFGKFCTEPVIREPMLMTRITTSPTCSVSYPVQLKEQKKHHFSPTAVLSSHTSLPSQVHAFRQHISTTQESFKRRGGAN